MKKIKNWFVGLLALVAFAAHAQFAPGQILTAAQLNSAFSNVLALSGGTLTGPLTVPTLNTANAQITGGALSGISPPIPIASGGTGSATATGARTALGAAPIISASTVLNVPSQYATIQAALNYLSGFVIANNATVTIQVANGTYASGSAININQPFGPNISIIGNPSSPSSVVLQFSTSDGVDIATGTKIGTINGFTIQNTGAKANFGVATYGGQINQLGPNLVVDNFYYGVAALNGGTIYANGTDSTTNRIEVKNAGDAGIWAISGSFVSANYAYVHDTVDSANNLGGGLVAEFASSIVANNATSKNNYLANIISQSGSGVRAWNGTFDHAGTLSNSTTNPNTTSVANVITNSLGAMEIFGSTVSNSLGYGNSSDGTGQLFGGVGSSTYSGNAIANVKEPFHINSDTSTSVNSGSLKIDATGVNATSGATFLDQNISPSNFSAQRFLTAGTEVWRQQYSNTTGNYTWSAGGITGLTFAPATGIIQFGRQTSVGAIGNVQEFQIGMSNTLARLRERDTNDHIALTSNISVGNVQDNATYPSWEMAFGGNGDTFSVRRSPPGSTSLTNLITLSNIGNLAATGTGTMPLYGTAGTAINAPHKVIGSVALSSGSATVTLSGSAVFTSSGSYVCTANDTTAANAVKVGQTSGTSITFTGTGSDTVQFACAGN